MNKSTDDFSEDDVKTRAQAIQRALENDSSPVSEQCEYFEQSLSTFLQEAQKS